MSHRFLRRLSHVLAAAVFAGCFAVPTESEAGPLLDWLFKRREARRLAMSPAGCCGDGAYCEQTVVNYVPQTSYRTVWQPVPVTTYRRTTHCNPTTGLPITCTRPCTSYTYQARRVPYTSYRPVYSKVPVSVPTQTVNYLPAANTGCNSCSVGSSGYSSIPNYGSPGYSIPSSRAPQYADNYSSNPSGATQWERVGPSDRAGDYDRGGYRTGDPADDIPSVINERRGEKPIIEGRGASYSRALRRIPSTSRQTVNRYDSDPYYRDRATNRDYDDRYERDRYERDRYNRDEYDRRRSTDAYTERSSNRRQNYRSDDTTSRYARIDRDIPARASNREFGDSILRRHSESRQGTINSNPTDLQPIHNEAPSRATPRKELPPLLNTGRDREASIIRPIATRWASNKIYWNEVARVERQRGRDGESAVRHASAEEPVGPRATPRRKSVRRRTDSSRSNGQWESNSPRTKSAPATRRREKSVSDTGWE